MNQPGSHAPSHVLGFAFDESLQQVLLLRKNRPKWAAGKVNGLGGKLEPGELPEQAMSREFLEECGLRVPPEKWVYLGMLRGPEWSVACFAAIVPALEGARTMEDEEVFPLPVSRFLELAQQQPYTYADLDGSWIVSFAQRRLRQPERKPLFSVDYPSFD